MRTKQIIWAGLLFPAFLSGLFACKDDGIEAKSPPQILYHSAELVVDLNQAATPAVIAVINSETGLKSVSTYILKEGGAVEQLDLPETRFYNPHSYSLKKIPLYTEDMVAVRVVAVDLAGQQLTSELPMRVIPLVDLPEVWFTDANGTRLTSYIHYQGDPMPSIRVHAEGPEDLKTLLPFQVLSSSVQQIVDAIEIPAGRRSIDISLQDMDDGFEFNSRIIALRVKITAGALNRVREAVLPVKVMKAVSVIIDQDDQAFNGLTIDAAFDFSGTVEFQLPLKEATYTLLDRKRQPMGGGEQLLMTTPVNDTKVAFTETGLPANVNLGYIVVSAELENGKIDTYEIPVHVGYKYWHLLTSSSGPGGAAGNHMNPGGCILNTNEGKIHGLCEGAANWENCDVGFAAYGELRIQNLGYGSSNKFQSNSPGCSLYTSSTNQTFWPNKNTYTSAIAMNTTPATFMEVTAADLAAETNSVNLANTANFITNIYEEDGPRVFNVVFYTKKVGGQNKKVILCADRVESWKPGASPTSYNYWESTFWIHVKTEI